MYKIISITLITIFSFIFTGCAKKYVPAQNIENNSAKLILPADQEDSTIQFAIADKSTCANEIYKNDANYKNGQSEMITTIPSNKIIYLSLFNSTINSTCSLFAWFEAEKRI